MATTSTFMHGNDGEVIWLTVMGDQAANGVKFAAKITEEEVDVGVFNESDNEDIEGGRQKCSGVVTIKPRHDQQAIVLGAGVLTLKSRKSAPYHLLTGSAFCGEIPFGRTRGDEPDTMDVAFRMTGSEWAYTQVSA